MNNVTPGKLEGLRPQLQHALLELEMNDFAVEALGNISAEAVLEEIAFVLNPVPHEIRIANYGSILSPFDIPGQLVQRLQTQHEVKLSVMREAADGLQRFVVYCGKPEAEFCLLKEPFVTELDLLNLSRSCQGLVLKRRESGLVTLAYKEQVFTARGRQWLRRKSTYEMIQDLAMCVPIVNRDIASRIIELCCYILSPMGIGATLVWFIKEPTPGEAETGGTDVNIEALGLRVTERSDYSQIIHFAGQEDGAFVLGPKGDVRSVGLHLNYGRSAEDLISKYKGTRHTSAKRYSFEQERAVVFVVSQDGHVSIFSDGSKVSDSPLLRAGEQAHILRSMVPSKAGDVTTSSLDRTCPRCGKMLKIEVVSVVGLKEPAEAQCPICSAVVYHDMCWSARAFVLKRLSTQQDDK